MNSLKSLFHETFLTSTFSEQRLPEGITLCLATYEAEMFKTDVPPMEEKRIKYSLVSKHYRDSTSSNDEFSSYAESIKLISTRSTPDPVYNETLDLYSEGATLSKFIHEGRPTTTKPTFVALPSFTSHSTFYKCSRGILCQPQDSPHSPLTRLGVIISYSLRLERKITLPSTSIICWNITMESTPKKLIYSTSRNSTTFQVGILSSISLIKST